MRPAIRKLLQRSLVLVLAVALLLAGLGASVPERAQAIPPMLASRRAGQKPFREAHRNTA